MSTAYITAAGLYLGGLLVRDVYELLKKAGRVDTSDARIFAARVRFDVRDVDLLVRDGLPGARAL